MIVVLMNGQMIKAAGLFASALFLQRSQTQLRLSLRERIQLSMKKTNEILEASFVVLNNAGQRV
jgi:hypothetical protein